MNEVALNYNEKDLLIYFQQVRLLKDKYCNDNKIGKSFANKENASFKDTLNSFGKFLERNLKSYDASSEAIKKEIDKFNSKNEKVMDVDSAKSLVASMFANDKYGLTKLLFAVTVILDDEYSYEYVDEGLEDVSETLYGDKVALPKIREQLDVNYRALSLTSLAGLNRSALTGVAGAWMALTLVFAPMVAVTSAIVGAVAAHELLSKNREKIKEEFKKSSSQNNAFYLALQLTYLQRIKETLNEDEFKEEFDSILKNVQELKSDLDYYLFVEKEATKDNKDKVRAFHEFDNRLVKILGLDK